jgi:hypothetical protein
MKTLRHHLLSTAVVFAIREATEILEGLEFNESNSSEDIALDYNNKRIVSQARLS